MNRRTFLKLTGLVAAGQALHTVPVAAEGLVSLAPAEPSRYASVLPPVASLSIQQPGTYLVSGLVRLEDPLVEIRGLEHTQAISWSGVDQAESPLVSFTSYERYDAAGPAPAIRVVGGRLESLTAVLVDD